MKLDITDVHFIELQKKGYTLDMVLMLSWLNANLDISHIIDGSKKIETIYKTMRRKQLISEEGELTKVGIEILTFVSKRSNKTFIKPKPEASDFDKWWDIFPSNDKFTIGSKDFGPSRSFRVRKEDCRRLFNDIVLSEKYTAQEIIDATIYDVELKKKLSLKNNKNELKYLQNTYTYLYQGTYEGFVGMKHETKIPTKNMGSVDI